MSQGNLQPFHDGLAARNEGDYEAIIDMCDPNVAWTFSDRLPDATGAIRGKPAVQRFFETFTGACTSSMCGRFRAARSCASADSRLEAVGLRA
jgi:ketosteroid isomerase-like protein